MASPPSSEPYLLLEAEASGNPATQADSFDETTHNPETLLVKRVAVNKRIIGCFYVYCYFHLSVHFHIPIYVYIALRFPMIVLQEKNRNCSHAFSVFFAPEDITSLLFCDSGTLYHLDVRLRQPPGIVSPDCPRTGSDGSEVDSVRIRVLGLEAAACMHYLSADQGCPKKGCSVYVVASTLAVPMACLQ
ncbi:uncharacterized protein PG998_014586 [Apiospora kogelbergensis]|uniref:uncharacterized protein n=1 Tax=Apiospora kogelbergensis TaxID=1337665 RepID=UPI00313292BF